MFTCGVQLLEIFFHASMPCFFLAAMLIIDAWALIVKSKLKVKCYRPPPVDVSLDTSMRVTPRGAGRDRWLWLSVQLCSSFDASRLWRVVQRPHL